MICAKCGRETSIRYFLAGIATVTRKIGDGMWVCASCVAKSCGITIPKSLTEKLPGAHYIRLKSCSKQPIDKEWPSHPMKPDDQVLQQHLAAGGNYGVVGGNGVFILDADIEEIKQTVEKCLPETFTVQSPGSLGWHCYYRSDLKDPVRLRDVDENGKKVNVGDVQGYGKMVVGPDSFHPNGERYKIVKNVPLAWVSAEDLREALSRWIIIENKKATNLTRQVRRERQLIDINVLDVVPLAGLRKSGDEYYGSHPVHGSKTGRNFWVNPSKNCWYCFRHDSYGGPLLWVAVEEGIIDCADAGSNALKGDVFKQVLKAVEKRGFKVPNYLFKRKKPDFHKVLRELEEASASEEVLRATRLSLGR